jgi:hypothetical protein
MPDFSCDTISTSKQLGIMFTSIKNGKLSAAVNDIDMTGPLTIPSTFVAADTVPRRQWHHWNNSDNIAKIKLKEGEHTITIHTVETGEMNYDYINFKQVK